MIAIRKGGRQAAAAADHSSWNSGQGKCHGNCDDFQIISEACLLSIKISLPCIILVKYITEVQETS